MTITSDPTGGARPGLPLPPAALPTPTAAATAADGRTFAASLQQPSGPLEGPPPPVSAFDPGAAMRRAMQVMNANLALTGTDGAAIARTHGIASPEYLDWQHKRAQVLLQGQIEVQEAAWRMEVVAKVVENGTASVRRLMDIQL